MAKRIQRKRTKGWKMPDNTIYVGRPTKWGNPFKVVGEEGHWFAVDDCDIPVATFNDKDDAIKQAVDCYAEYISSTIINEGGILTLSELKGKNLACFCPLDKPCHADVLLKIANK